MEFRLDGMLLGRGVPIYHITFVIVISVFLAKAIVALAFILF
jgi:hypothetical protein